MALLAMVVLVALVALVAEFDLKQIQISKHFYLVLLAVLAIFYSAIILFSYPIYQVL